MQLENDYFSGLEVKFAAELEYLTALFTAEGINISKPEMLVEIDNAWRAIVSYLWVEYASYDSATYFTPVVKLSQVYINNQTVRKSALKGEKQVQQTSQGSMSVSFRNTSVELDSNGLTAEVKAVLPPRKLRVL